MITGEDRQHFIGYSDNVYIRTENKLEYAILENEHHHKLTEETIVVERGRIMAITSREGSYQYKIMQPREAHTFRIGEVHTLLLWPKAVIHTIKYNAIDGDWYGEKE